MQDNFKKYGNGVVLWALLWPGPLSKQGPPLQANGHDLIPTMSRKLRFT